MMGWRTIRMFVFILDYCFYDQLIDPWWDLTEIYKAPHHDHGWTRRMGIHNRPISHYQPLPPHATAMRLLKAPKPPQFNSILSLSFLENVLQRESQSIPISYSILIAVWLPATCKARPFHYFHVHDIYYQIDHFRNHPYVPFKSPQTSPFSRKFNRGVPKVTGNPPTLSLPLPPQPFPRYNWPGEGTWRDPWHPPSSASPLQKRLGDWALRGIGSGARTRLEGVLRDAPVPVWMIQ